MKLVIAALAVSSLIYASVVGMFFVAQRSFIYPAPTGAGAAFGALSGFDDVRLRTSDRLTLRAAYRPARGRPTIVFFHGNGSDLRGAEVATRALGARGYGLLLPEYRGYGGNLGSPSEIGLYRDGEAALGWLARHGIAAEDIVLVGNSLGSGVATELATGHHVRALAIVSGFTSLADVAAPRFRWLPVRWLLRDRYENLAKIGGLAMPVLVLHGADDTLVPASQGAALARAARQGTLVTVPGVGHDLAYRAPSQIAIEHWLEKRERPAG